VKPVFVVGAVRPVEVGVREGVVKGVVEETVDASVPVTLVAAASNPSSSVHLDHPPIPHGRAEFRPQIVISTEYYNCWSSNTQQA